MLFNNTKYSSLISLFQSFSDSISDINFIIDEENNLLFANKNFIKYFKIYDSDFLKFKIEKYFPEIINLLSTFRKSNLDNSTFITKYTPIATENYKNLELNLSKIPEYLGIINILISNDYCNDYYLDDDNSLSKINCSYLLNSSPTLVWKSDINGKINYVNQAFNNYLGFEIIDFDNFNKEDYIFIDDLEKYRNILKEKLIVAVQFKLNYRLKNSKNEYNWVKENFVPLFDENSEHIGFAGYLYDINNLKQNEKINSTLFNASDTFFNSSTINELYINFYKSLKDFIYFKNFVIVSKSKTNQINFEFSSDYSNNSEFKIDHSLIEFVFESNTSMLLNQSDLFELATNGKINEIEEDLQNLISVPILIKNSIFGFIIILSNNKSTYNIDNFKVIIHIVKQMSLAIERIIDKNELVYSETKFRNLFLSLNDSIAYNTLLFDENGNPSNYLISEVNPIYKKHFGVNENKILNRPIFSDSEPKPYYFDIFLKVVNTKKIETFELFFPFTKKYFNTTVYPVSENEFITSYKDITSEKNAIIKLETQRYQIQQILDISEVLIGLIDFKGTIISINRKAIELLGYEKDELTGANWLDIIDNPEFTNSYRILYEDFIKYDKRSIKKLEIEILTKQKVKKTIYFHNVLLTEGKDKILGLLFSGIDITERIEFENDLLISKKKIEEASKLKSVILGNLSHELRTPLNGILGFSHLLKDDLKGTDAFEMVDLINKSGSRLMNTINSLLTLAEIEADNLYVNFEHVYLAKVLEYYCWTYKEMANDKGLTFDLIINDPDVQCSIDEYLFNQVLFNLIDNSVKYTNTGGISIILDKEVIDNFIYATVKVSDTGVGISEKHSRYIFEAFRQGSEGIDRTFEGVGLGLTLTEKMVSKLQGFISFDSEVNVGTVFKISFLVT